MSRTPASLGPNERLIGVPGGRAELDTPALCIDLPALERNIAAMAAHARAVGVQLRPHAKTHKSVAIARLQQEAGAIGISCATLGEAEAMVAGGLKGVLVTSPQVTPAKLRRLVVLNAAQQGGLAVVADHPRNVDELGAAATAAGQTLDVLVDCAAGHHRTGVADAASFRALVERILRTEGLRFAGVQHYSGNLQHIPERAKRREAALARLAVLREWIDDLRRSGIDVPVVSGAGTGTFDLDPEARLFSELQTGSYVFMDVDYLNALRDGRNAPPFEVALFVQTAVVSVNAAGRQGWVTSDGGLKCFATDGPLPEILAGAPAGSRYEFFGDEHGKVVLPPGAPALRLGGRLDVLTPHCDPTVNLHEFFHVLRGDTLVDIWPVDARGKR